MEVIYGSKDTGVFTMGRACALGFFDGVHAGHQNLITILKQVSDNKCLESMVFTFEKHPLSLLNESRAPKLITDNYIKSKLFSSLGVDTVYYSQVNMDFLRMEPEIFLKQVLRERLNVKAVIAGFNFRFGFEGKGNADLLKEFGRINGMEVTIVNPVYIDGILVSSTNVRNALMNGDIKTVNRLLNREYSMHGTVVHGVERGRKMGFPTANISVSDELLVPKNGVYVTKVSLDGIEKPGLTNIGYNPTFGNKAVSIETHIMDFNGDLYGKEISLKFYERIRDEIRFSSITQLIDQLGRDRIFADNYLLENN